MNAIRILERHAIHAHARSETWATFWNQHAEAIREAEWFNVNRYHRLVRRLLAFVVSGDYDGQQPVGDGLEPWDVDDAHKPADVGTKARCQLLLPLLSIPGVTTADQLET